MNIEWRAKIGYGDFMSPICYANMQSFRKRKHTTLWFHYKNDKNWKVNKQTPWTVFNLAIAIDHLAIQTSVETFHTFNDGFEVDYINFNPSHNAHNFWLSEYHTLRERNIIIINTTLPNEIQIQDYGKEKMWKDPLNIKWPQFLKLIREKYPNETIVEVSYRDPLKRVHDLYSRCKLAIGYHGSTMHMAKFLFCPMFIFSSSCLVCTAAPESVGWDSKTLGTSFCSSSFVSPYLTYLNFKQTKDA